MQGLRPCTRKSNGKSGVKGLAGRVGFAGDAVNPSLEA